MGNVLIRNTSPLPGESNVVTVISSKLNDMAEQNPGNANKQHIATQEVFEAFKTCFTQAQLSNQQFLECGNAIVRRQSMLESEIEKYRER